MLAIRSDGNTPEFTRSAPAPQACRGEAVVCPVHLAIDEPDLVPRGVIPGHQFVGVVEHVEGEPDHPLVGERVVGSPDIPCRDCELCRRGLSRHCPDRAHLGIDRDGCFAERFVLSVANIVRVPDELSDDQAIFAHPLACALHAASILRIEAKPYVTVIGDRSLALLTAQAMRKLNAAVRVLGFSRDRLELCAKWGVKHRLANEAGRRADQDAVFICTDRAEDAELAFGLVRPMGTVVAARTIPSIDPSPITSNELRFVGARSGNIAEALARLPDFDVLSLITRRMRFEDTPRALGVAREPGQIKVVLDPPQARTAAA